jgi:uncharacterized membrane protein
MARTVTDLRSVTKALTYRVVIMCLDFGVIYLLTRTIKIAVGFMILSNIYTTIAYFVHERLWAHVSWGVRDPGAA